MSQKNTPKLNVSGGKMGKVFLAETDEDALRIDRVYTEDILFSDVKLSKVDQKHDARMNLVLPEQLLEVFGKITEREVGKRAKSAVIEHLMIEYCREHGAEIVNR